jgi:hypothetical protein
MIELQKKDKSYWIRQYSGKILSQWTEIHGELL